MAKKIRIIDVPDVPGPTAQLCWAQNLTPPSAMARCNRRKGHGGMHTWEMVKRIKELEAQLGTQA